MNGDGNDKKCSAVVQGFYADVPDCMLHVFADMVSFLRAALSSRCADVLSRSMANRDLYEETPSVKVQVFSVGGHGPGKARWYEVNMNASWFDTVEGWLDEDPTGYRITIFRVAGQPDSEDAVVFDGGCLDVTKSMLEAFEAPNY